LETQVLFRKAMEIKQIFIKTIFEYFGWFFIGELVRLVTLQSSS